MTQHGSGPEAGAAAIVSVVGYAKSGKTSFAAALIRAATARGFRTAAIKTGHHAAAPVRRADGLRLAAAGARPVIFWNKDGAVRDDTDTVPVTSAPLPSRDEFGEIWQDVLPQETVRSLLRAHLLVVEGRIVPGAVVVQMKSRDGPDDGRLKYPRDRADWIVSGPSDNDQIMRGIITMLEEKREVPEKSVAGQWTSDRSVRLVVNGEEVKLNGFVKDIFRETVVGLVRALRTEDEGGSIELTISRAPETAE